jgi:acetyl-CoA carboxylase carboxyltransferase component
MMQRGGSLRAASHARTWSFLHRHRALLESATAAPSAASGAAKGRATLCAPVAKDPKDPAVETDPARTTIEDVARSHEQLSDASRPAAVERQHSLGKLTARERIELLLDDGSGLEVGALVTPDVADVDPKAAPADGLVAVMGEVDGRPVSVFATDFTVLGGSLGDTGMRKIIRMVDLSLQRGIPLVMLIDGGGHRIHEIDARPYAFGGDSGPFWRQALVSGWAPQVGAVMGPAFAGSALFTSFSDFVRQLVKAAMGETLTTQELGGSDVQMRNGNADMECPDDESCIAAVREFLSFMPTNASGAPPVRPTADPPDRPSPELRDVIPASSRTPYDVKQVIRRIVDDERVFELQPAFARNLVIALARLDGRPVGIIANQPKFLGGVIDTPACEKATRFVEMCNAYGLPLVSLTDGRAAAPGASRRQTAAGARARHRAARDGRAAQGIRRRLPGDGRRAHGCRRGAHLAHRGDERDGHRGRGRRRLPPPGRRRRGSRRQARGADPALLREIHAAARRLRLRRRRRDRPRRHPSPGDRDAADQLRAAAEAHPSQAALDLAGLSRAAALALGELHRPACAPRAARRARACIHRPGNEHHSTAR